jgi:hypothetical protein
MRFDGKAFVANKPFLSPQIRKPPHPMGPTKTESTTTV